MLERSPRLSSTLMRPATVWAEPLKHIVETCAARRGISASSFARAAGVSLDSLGPRASMDALYRVWAEAMRDERRALPSMVAEALPLERLGPYGFALLTASSGAESLRFAARAYPWINGRTTLRVRDEQSTRVTLDVAAPTSIGEAASHVAIVSHVLFGLRRIVGEGAVRSVRFHQRAPKYARDLDAMLACRVEWDARVTEVEVDRARLDARPPLASPETSAVLRSHIERALSAGRASALTSMVEALAIGATAAELAARARVSDRTVRRRFASESTTLRSARDAARAERALTLLGEPGKSVTEVALALGFADSSTFARAFRRWHGASPSSVRPQRKPR